MTLAEAHEKSQPGDRLRHAEYQIVIARLEGRMETIFQMSNRQFVSTNDDGWTILKAKKLLAVTLAPGAKQ